MSRFKLSSLSALAIALGSLSTAFAGAPGSDPVDLLARLAETGLRSSLDADDVKPWHLKLGVQLFDEAGKPTEKGEIETWWISQKEHRTTWTFPSYEATELHTGGKVYRTKAAVSESEVMDDMWLQIVHPMATEFDMKDTVPELRKQKLGAVDLECIMLNRPSKERMTVPLGLFPTYCLDPGKEMLRLQMEFGSPSYVRNRVGTFQGRSVSTQIDARLQSVESATAEVMALNVTTPSAIDLAPSAELEEIGAKAAPLDSKVSAGKILKKIQPVLPQGAEDRRASGTVVLNAVISREGHIRRLHIVSTPDPDLAISAIAAVRLWTYEPYKLNDLPVEVMTTISVIYSYR